MFKTLNAKLLGMLVCFAVVMALLFLVVMRHLDTTRNQELHQKLYRSLASQLVSEHILPQSEAADSLQIQRVFDRLRVINPRIDVYLLDAGGKILASSGRTKTLRSTVNLQPVKQFLGTNAELPIFGDDPTEASRRRVFSAAEISLDNQVNGYLYLIMRGLGSDSIAERIKDSYVLRGSLWIIVWGLLFALLAGAVTIKFMTQPLRQLTAVMDKFRQDGLPTQPAQPAARASSTGDEVTKITATFNEMSERLLEQMRALQHTDATRRALVANVSHDLRTPLASLQGYLETLQIKGDKLSAEEKETYLDIALKQCGQLRQLVNALFELAKLEADQASIQPEPFVLEDLVQDVAQQFELEAANKRIALATDMPAELPLVVADIGLIERVLRNLIENSLQYTPAGGEIRVRLIADRQHMTVEVTDTGCGIEAEHLPHIFDRFYRAEKSRSEFSGHAGLGLAIAKRILDLHHSTITLHSKPGKTTITFTLAYANARAVPHSTASTAALAEIVPSSRPVIGSATALPQRAT
ncbi:MAG TPA: ATP-binding protein [Burkholderiales bacterium]|nr:ATP-binding protein [Burkholderiales bacterium]